VGNGDNHNIEIISLHIPKTAGTTFRHILVAQYGENGVYFDYPYNYDVKLHDIDENVRVIHGHFLLKKYGDSFKDAKRITWLRNPVTRMISHYCFWKMLPLEENNPLQKLLKENDLDIVEFAELPDMQNHLMQFYLDGTAIGDFYFIGIQEHFKQEMRYLRRLMKWKSVRNQTINKNSDQDYSAFIKNTTSSKKIIEKLESLNSLDMRYYHEALELQKKRRWRFF